MLVWTLREKFMKKLLFILGLMMVGWLSLANLTVINAFSSILGAKTIINELRIEGIKVEDPQTVININSHTPTFSGYSEDNLKLIFTIKPVELQRETLTDNHGYWAYTLNSYLADGQYQLWIRSVNSQDISGDDALVATFKIEDQPTVLGLTSDKFLNLPKYLSFSLIISLIILFLVIIYLVLRRRLSYSRQ